jgi:hypothetical protein
MFARLASLVVLPLHYLPTIRRTTSFSWMKSNFTKLLDFVGVAVDFGALSAAMDFSKMLA